MNGGALRLALYRFGATFRGRGGSYLALVLLVGLVGGVAMGAVAAARRTQSSFPAFLASTNPSDMSVGTGLYSPGLGFDSGYDAGLVRTISGLPHVKRVESFAALNAYQLKPDGSPNTGPSGNIVGSVDGEYFDQDRLTVTTGRMADPTRVDEMVMSAAAAREFKLHVGDTTPWAVYRSSAYEPTKPALRLEMTLVGIVVFNDAVVQDQVDASGTPQSVVFTPALSRRMVACCSNYAFSYLQLDHGSRSVATVESEIEQIFPSRLPFDPHASAVVEAKAQRAIKPEAIALGVFGGIAAIAALLIAAQLIVRHLRLGAGEGRTLRALGAGPSMTMVDGLLGIVASVVAGSILAAAVAVALSPLAPLGPVRPVDPTPGVSFDWTVLGLGFLVLVVGLGAIALILAHRWAPHRVAQRDRTTRARGSGLTVALAAAGMPTPAVTGVRFALQAGDDRDPVPVRSAILGAVLAMVVVISTVVFGSSLNSLVSHPDLYGWNWNYELSGGGGVGDIPQRQAASLLDHDPDVAAWSGYYFGTLRIDSQTVPVLGGTPGATVEPPVLSGHGLQAREQVVLGASTLAALHKHVGDTIEVAFAAAAPTRLRIVGTATMPTIGITGVDTNHLSMGTGAVLRYELIPAAVRDSFGNDPPGPNAVFVRLRNGADPASSLRALKRIASTLTLPTNYGVTLMTVQLPAEIINYRSMGSTPAFLGVALGAGTVAALGLTLMASVKRRRRELALLKTLGFTEGQLAASISWQASVAVAIGATVGVPLGIIVGRVLWELFARQIDAVPAPNVPTLSVVLITVGALVLANVVAAIPGRIAARTPTALLLRAE
ncbi:MAG TPA: ABC transporter permease [Acidimicrobiales bacterium]|nr:ABC transporter permease [Acidimicrobiales bacterium]